METVLSIEARQPGLIHRSLRAKYASAASSKSTLDARLIALDAATGVPCPDFGSSGQVDLRNVPGINTPTVGEHMRGWYHMTSPPVTIDDMVIVGSAIDDNNRVDMPSGSCGLSMRVPEPCGGVGIPFRRTYRVRPRP